MILLRISVFICFLIGSNHDLSGQTPKQARKPEVKKEMKKGGCCAAPSKASRLSPKARIKS